MENLVLLDGYAMMFRSYYAVRFAPQYKGQNVNAVYGCATTIMQALEQFNPAQIVVAFDAPEKTFRHELDDAYKAQREAAPDEFVAQISLVQDLIDAFGIPRLIMPGFEADDIIGTLATRPHPYHTYIMSGDLDFLQLVNERVTLARFNGKSPDLFDREATIAKLGLPPEQVIDYKALCGDSSDNYKGLPGLGPKGASKLLAEYGSIADIYNNLPALPEKQQAKFKEHKDYVYHCQHLATIHTDVPLDFEINPQHKYTLPLDSVINFYLEIGFPSLINRVKNLNTNNVQFSSNEPKKDSGNDSEVEQISLF